MVELEIWEVADFDTFSSRWPDAENETRLYWQLLGQLEPDEILIRLPKWLAEEATGYVQGAVATTFIGQIEQETGKAIRLANSASATDLLKLAHRIHELEQNEGADRSEWLDRRLEDHRQKFRRRQGAATLSDEWIPKSQIEVVVRRLD